MPLSTAHAETTDDLAFRWYRSPQAIAELAGPRWRLLELDPDCTPCQTPDYVKRWWQFFGENRTLEMLSIWQAQELVALLTLANQDGRWEMLGDRERWIVGLVGKSSVKVWQRVLAAMEARRNDWGEIRLRIDAPQKAAGLITALRQSNLHWVDLRYSQVGQRPQADQSESGPTQNGSSDRPQLKIFRSALRPHIERLMHYSIQSPLRRQPSHYLDPRQCAHLLSLVEQPLASHHLWVAVLTQQGQEAALAVGLTWQNRAVLLAAAANPVWALQLPINVLVKQLRRWAAGENLSLPLPETEVPFWAHQWHTEIVITSSWVRRLRYALPQLTAEWSEHAGIMKRPAGIFDRFLFAPLRRHSLPEVSSMLAHDVADFVYSRHCWFVMAHDKEVVSPVAPQRPVQIVIADPSWLDRIAAFYGAPRDSGKYEAYQRRFAEGADCFLGLIDGNIATLFWGLYKEDLFFGGRLSLTPAPGEVVLADAFTSPIYRGSGVNPYLLAHVLEDYQARGIRPIAAIADYNRSSLRAVEKVGFRTVRSLPYRHLFGIRIQ